MQDFFVSFKISDSSLLALQRVFSALRAAKQSEERPDPDDPYWRSFFTHDQLSQFWNPTEKESEDWNRRWFQTPLPERFSDPSLATPWHFESMIDAFLNGDYDLVSCERIDAENAAMIYEPHGWPYGGTGCMHALIEAFHGSVVAEKPQDGGI